MSQQIIRRKKVLIRTKAIKFVCPSYIMYSVLVLYVYYVFC